MKLAEKLRNEMPKLKLQLHCGGGNFKKQLKKADKSQAKIALILGGDEVEQKQVTIKYLREKVDQVTINQSSLASKLKEIFV